MTLSSQHYLVITALGADRPGIVNTITRHVSSCGCNIEDSRLAMLGEEFTFIMLLSGSWNAITLIESTRSKPYVQNSMHKAVLTSSIIPNMMNRMELSNESTESR